jgi:hypothetical protein
MKPKRSKPTRPRAIGPTGIGDVLKTLKKRSRLGVQLEQARKLCAHGRPRAIKDGRLVVDVDTAVSMHRFAYRKFAIIRRINAMAEKELISDIFFQMAPDEDPTPPADGTS